MLEEQLEIVHRLLTEDRFTFEGHHYTLADAEFLPKPRAAAAPADRRGRHEGRAVDAAADRRVGGRVQHRRRRSPDEVRERFARARDGVGSRRTRPDDARRRR